MQNERQPLYIQIQEYFRHRISNSELKVGEKIPSEKELMEQFDVSRITVANALMQLAKDGWIYRVPGRGSFVQGNQEEAEESLTEEDSKPPAAPEVMINTKSRYLGNKMERNASENKTKRLGLIVPYLIDYFSLRLIQGINRVLEKSEYSLCIVQTYNRIEREEATILELVRDGVEGLIIFPCDTETYNEEVLTLKQNKYPFVLIDRYFHGVETNSVRCDGLVGGEMAVDYLWNLGHRDIAICSDSPFPTITVEDRISGYMEGLKQKGALINPSLILTDFLVEYKGVDPEHPLYRFIKNRMATAFITLNSRLGLHLMAICRELGLRVPEDISILTFDDPSPGTDESGFVSYISQSEDLMGEEAARILTTLLADKAAEQDHKYHKILLQPKLVERQSTAKYLRN
ncbi:MULTISPECIES: GntR family transcriptional regulator [Paenibacillus]|uniref:GntR family transcriptional regulator n=1 Tax=Paenibacillus odorifer TaxID=189426 RepID=A0A1R0Y882_9BACL|nr:MULTISPECIES: GntR family transcriptional regulator [Paenibacillus]AIQ37171.1 GntR family transcriptional regulator [Paenibacillus sp. FSL R5-0345]OMD43496.1 GntR family transcriptional regulator [Paenibacillus odorifer]